MLFFCLVALDIIIQAIIPFDAFASTTDSASVFASVNVNDFIGAIDTPDASAIKITSAEELYAIRNDMYGSYVLMVSVKSTCIPKMPSQRSFTETANSYLHLLGSTF